MSETNQTPTDQLMEQAQVFASAWSLVGGPLDSGHALDNAEEAKDELREMIDDLCEQCSSQINDMGESVQKLIEWHGRQVGQLNNVLAVAKNEGTIDLSDGKPIKLTKDSAYGMRLGIALALHLLGKLPITLTRD
ncbi:MAG: host nuclease inhibitor protein [Pseudomonas sp.]